MFSILGVLLSILFVPFSFVPVSWLNLSDSPPAAPSTQAPAPTDDKELTVTRWEETYAPLPDPTDQPTPQGPAAPLGDPDLPLEHTPSLPDQVTP